MAEHTRGMGRGLAAILSSSQSDDGPELRELPVDLIVPNPHQPRRILEEQPPVALLVRQQDGASGVRRLQRVASGRQRVQGRGDPADHRAGGARHQGGAPWNAHHARDPNGVSTAGHATEPGRKR